jgi:hypothetical protein
MKDKYGNTIRVGCIVVLPFWANNRAAKVLGSREDMIQVTQDPSGEDDYIFFFPADVVRIEHYFK